MRPQGGPPVAGERLPKPPARDAVSEYRRLLATLAAKARWLGSRDPESAAQETLTRSLKNPTSHQAVEYYFSQDPPDGLNIPDWPLDHLLAWLHAVLRYVVREERSRTGFHREVPVGESYLDPADPATGPLEMMIEQELRAIVVDCFPKLEREQRQVLTMRVDGLKYGEIASRLGVNENTVATWVSRGIRELGRQVPETPGGRMTDRIDRYVRGELSPEEARALAQESLDSPALFDELTDAALAKAALDPATVRRTRVIRMRRRTAVVSGGVAAAAAFLLISLPHRPSIREPNVRPVLELSSNARQPVLLASGLHQESAPVFRGGEPESRAPQAAGVIVSIEDGNGNIDLGSVDGLAKGSELQVFRGSDTVGRLQVTAVFRDRARAGAMEGQQLRPKDEVRVAAADHLNALLQQVDAAYNRGDPDTAIKLAEQAVRWGESAAVPPGAMAVSWNQLAVLQMLKGDYDGAESHLLRASSATSPTDLFTVRSRTISVSWPNCAAIPTKPPRIIRKRCALSLGTNGKPSNAIWRAFGARGRPCPRSSHCFLPSRYCSRISPSKIGPRSTGRPKTSTLRAI